MKKYLFLICLFMVLQGCKKKPYEGFSEFPSEVNLTHQLIEVKGMADPGQVILLYDAVIILDEKSDFSFHVLNPINYAHVGSFIRRGHGPNEEMIIQTMMKLAENQFFYKTLSHIKIIDYSAEPPEFLVRKSIPVFVNDLIAAFMLNGIVYGWNREAREKEFIQYNGADKMLDFGAEFPLPERNFSPREQMHLFSEKQVTVKPDGQLFAATYNYLPLLRIFDAADGSVQQEIRFENKKPFPNYLISGNEAEWEHVTQNYWFTKSSNNYIYALYTGKTFGESGYSRNGPGNAVVDLANEIHVFDWEGNPVKRIITDKNLFNFDVSADDRILIAISKEDPDHIYEYRIK
jgi:hypothetical protein